MVEEIKKKVGERVRDARRQKGIRSADRLAEILGVSPTTMYELERGENWLSAEMLMRLSEVLEVKPSFFYDFDAPTGNVPPPKKPQISPEILQKLEALTPAQMKAVEALIRGLTADQEEKPLRKSKSGG
jgi:transcriptional regulator with XRE-family HTH domain